MKKFLKITITPATNGLYVHIGCRDFVYQNENFDQFISDLSDYLLHPKETEKRLAEKYGFPIGLPTYSSSPDEQQGNKVFYSRIFPGNRQEAERTEDAPNLYHI